MMPSVVSMDTGIIMTQASKHTAVITDQDVSEPQRRDLIWLT